MSLRLGTHATLLTGTGNITKNQAAKQQLRLQRPNMVALGKSTLTVTKSAPKTLTIRVPAKGAAAVGKKVKSVKVQVAFTVRNARGKVVKKSTKTFPIAVARK